MTALLRPDEMLTLGLNVIVRRGDPQYPIYTQDGQARGFVAPQDWVALTGPCPCMCHGPGFDTPGQHAFVPCPDCRDGRRIVPLYRACYVDHDVRHFYKDGIAVPTAWCDGQVLVGRGSIEVVPVVTTNNDWDGPHVLVRSDGWCFFIAEDGEVHGPLTLDPLPVPGRDWGIVIDCVEVAS